MRAFLIDINGVLYTGREPVEGASEIIEFLRENNYKFRFISNATRVCRKTLCETSRDLDLASMNKRSSVHQWLQ